MSNKPLSLGKRGEECARAFLMLHGYDILTSNYKVKVGEIDIIARQGGDLVFVEVKSRSGSNFGSPAEAVTVHKQSKIIKVAECYLAQRNLFDIPVRFDVVSVIFKRDKNPVIEVIKNAFEA